MANNTLEVSIALKAQGYKAEINNIKKENQLMRAEFDKLSSSVDKFENTLDGKKAKLNLVSKEYQNAQKQVEIYKKQVEISRKTLEDANKELQRQKAVIESTKKQIKDYSDAYGETSDVVKALEKGLEELEKDFEKQSRVVASANTNYQNMQIQLAKAEKAVNELGKEFESCTKDVSELEKKLNSVSGRLQESGSKIAGVGTSIKNVGGQITDVGKKFAAVSAGATAAGVSLFNMSESFSQGMNKVNTLVNLSKDDLSAYGDQLKTVAKDTGSSLTDLSESMYQAISAGVPLEQSIKSVEVATKLAKGGFTDTVSAMDLLTSAMNAMGISYDKVSIVSDKFLATQNAGKTTIAEMAGAIGQVAPTANAAGVSLDELLASVAALTSTGTGTSEAMTAMKATLSNVIKPSSQAAELANKLGLEFDSTALASKGLAGFLADVQEKTNGNVDDMALLFGSTEALNAILTLTGEGNEKFVESLESISNAGGETQNAFDMMSDSAGQKFANAINELKINLMDLGDKIAPIVELLAEGISKVSEAFGGMNEKTQTVIVAIGALLAIISPLIIIFGTVVTAVGSVIQFIGLLVSGIGTLIGWISSAIGAVSTFIATLNPITLVIAGVVAAVVAMGVAIYNNWDSIKSWTLDMVNNIKKWFDDMKNKFNEAMQSLSSAWQSYGQPLINRMKDIFNNLQQEWQKVCGKFTEYYNSKIKPMFDAFKQTAESARSLVSNAFNSIASAVGSAMSRVNSAIQGGINKIKSLFSWIKDATSRVGDFLNKINPLSKLKSMSIDMDVNGDIPQLGDINIPVNPIGDIALSGSYYNSDTPLSNSLARLTNMVNSLPATNALQQPVQNITMQQDNSQLEAIMEKYLSQLVQTMANFNPSIELNGHKVSEELNRINGQGLKLNERWR